MFLGASMKLHVVKLIKTISTARRKLTQLDFGHLYFVREP